MNDSVRPNPDPFSGTAWWYARYRPAYPPALFELLDDEFRLDGSGSVLDLGCGTGLLAIPLAQRFKRVTGLDPDSDILGEAARLANFAGATNITWIQGSSRELPGIVADTAPFRLVTMGRSFHWMDQPATLAALDCLVSAAGGLAILGDGSLNQEPLRPWQNAMLEVLQRWLGPEGRAGTSAFVPPDEHFEGIISRSAFSRVSTRTMLFERLWSLDQIVGYLYSTSYCSRAVLGDRAEGFERELRRDLGALHSDDQFAETVTLEYILAFRPR